MKVIAINSSARKDGNTVILLNTVLEQLKENGIETELIQLSTQMIEPCKACFACGQKQNCIHKKDKFYEIFEKMKEADGIILGSPVYSANVSAKMQALLERAAVVADMNPGLFTHKVGASVAAVRRAGAIQAIDTMNHFFLNHEMFVAGSTYWNMGYGQMPGDVEKDVEGMVNMKNLGQNMAYLLHALNGGNMIQFDLLNKQVALNNGNTMPINGIGTYSLLHDTCISSVKTALKNGVRLIDTAYMYHNEKEVGQAIKEAIEEYGIKREDIFVITKLYPGEQYKNPEQAIELALSKLDVGYIDMMLLHHPGTNDVKAYKAMEKYLEKGKIHSLGLSCWYIKELLSFLPQISIKPSLVQNEIHPYYQDSKVIEYIHSLDIAVQTWYPLGGRGYTTDLLNNKAICEIAKKYNVSSAQVILRWDLQNGVSVIPGSSNPNHIKENTQLYDFSLSKDDMKAIQILNRNEKHDWY